MRSHFIAFVEVIARHWAVGETFILASVAGNVDAGDARIAMRQAEDREKNERWRNSGHVPIDSLLWGVLCGVILSVRWFRDSVQVR